MEADPLDAGPDRPLAVRRMFDRIASRYDSTNRLLTFGLDRGWRRRAVAELGLAPGSVVADVGCGTGELCRQLAADGQRAVGFDASEGMLRMAGDISTVAQADALALPVADGAFDGATCGFVLRNVVDQQALFAELARVLRPGGRLALLEVAEPTWQPARAVHALYFRRVVPLVGSVVSDREAYRYLPESSALLPSTAELTSMLDDAGFRSWRRHLLGAGAAQLVGATRN